MTGIALFALLVLDIIFESTLASWVGAIQRLFIGSWLVWIEFMAIRVFRLSGRSVTRNI